MHYERIMSSGPSLYGQDEAGGQDVDVCSEGSLTTSATATGNSAMTPALFPALYISM